MNFTREPIIETVITPREGCKLAVRSSKGNDQEDYYVDAVEVVSFGHSFFFRSQERPKSFLVPVSDYEIIELKETRMVLKNVATERSIKIGGGRETPPRPQQQQREELREEEPQQQQRPSMDRKRDKRRRGRRGRDRDRHEMPQEQREAPPHDEPSHEPHHNEMAPSYAEGEEKAPAIISKLFPPPPTLIKETLSRYKPAEPTEGSDIYVEEEKTSFEESIFEHPEDDNFPPKNQSEGDEENPVDD